MRYNSQNRLIKLPVSTYKMDRESDRYRVCQNCGKEFMAYDRSLIYCHEKCRWEFHNTNKARIREEKKLEKENEKNRLAELETISAEKSEDSKMETGKESIKETDESILEMNVSILDSLQISKKGDNYNIDVLHNYGFQFSHFSGRGQLFNIDPNLNCHFIQVKNYRLYRVAFSTVLIINLIHVPC
jgi:hypothetical protein